MRSLYDWYMRLMRGPYAVWTLYGIAFIESSFFPIPPDLFLIPLILARRSQAFKIALGATIASVLGGLLGYGIGIFLYDSIGVHILNVYNYTAPFERFCAAYNKYGVWIAFGGAITPFPYKIITIASGVTQLDLSVFILSSVFGRGLRFFLIAWLLWKWGEPMKLWIEKNLGWLSVAFFALLIGGFLVLKLM